MVQQCGAAQLQSAARTLPQSALGSWAMVEASGRSYSSCIPAVRVGQSLRCVPPYLFFITSLRLGMVLTLCLCSASLYMGLSFQVSLEILLIHAIRR